MKGHAIKKLTKKFGGALDQSKYAPAHSIEEYFALPLEKREKWGFWYLKPTGLPLTSLDYFFTKEKSKDGWDAFKELIQKHYPIQGWFREVFFSCDNPLYSFFIIKKRQFKEIKYRIKCFFFPRHKRVRNALPKTWSDICYLIRELNFAMILDFYHGEVVDGWINWKSDKQHRDFIKWLKNAVEYIEKDRKIRVEQIDAAWDNHFKEKKPSVLQIGAMEKRLADKDKKILKEMIDWKEMFWT